jgi:hypothetical protein
MSREKIATPASPLLSRIELRLPWCIARSDEYMAICDTIGSSSWSGDQDTSLKLSQTLFVAKMSNITLLLDLEHQGLQSWTLQTLV